MSHDFEQQKAETLAVFAELADGAELPDEINVDYAFLPGASADWDAVQAALDGAGYDCQQTEPEPEDGPGAVAQLIATLPDQPVSALAIWTGEEIATRIALDHGFTPDGWGFWA
ncbi:MAG: ribonuclease E inhibitor RraB [Maritimibacter sp.]